MNEKWFRVWRHSHQIFTMRRKVVVVFFPRMAMAIKKAYGNNDCAIHVVCFLLLVWLCCLILFEHVVNTKNEIALLNGQLVMLKKEWTKELVDGNMYISEMKQQGMVN